MNPTKAIQTVCARDCYDVCSLVFDVDTRGRIISAGGDAEHPLTRGRLCPRSARDVERLYANRVDGPHVKTPGGFQKTDWDQSLRLVSQRLARTIAEEGPQRILFLTYAGNTGLFANGFPRRLWNAIGATQTDGALCSKSGHAGISLHYGLSYGANPLDIPHMKLLVFWGFNAAISAPHIWHLARRSQEAGHTKIVVVDPIETASARKADLWVQSKPGTDVALVYGLLNRIVEAGSTDTAFLNQWTSGFEKLQAEASRWQPDAVATLTGVGPGQLGTMAGLYAECKPSMTLIGYGLQHCANGADQVRAVSMIPALLGIHRGFYYGNQSAYQFDGRRISGKSLTARPPVIIPQVAVADHIKRGDFRVIYVSCMNPAMTLPNQSAFRESLARDDLFLVVHETHWTETARLADIVLPAPTFLEKEDIIIPDSHNYVQFSRRILPAVTDSRHEITVMRQIARGLKLQEDWIYEDAMPVITSTLAHAFEDGAPEDLLSGRRLKLKCNPRHHYPTPSGRIELYASTAWAQGYAPLPRQKESTAAKGTYTLITSSVSSYTHTQFQECYGPIPALVHINTTDAADLEIADGDTVQLANRLGRIRLQAVVTEVVPPGVVWCPKEAADLAGRPQNILTSSLPQSIGKGPRFNSTQVKLIKEEV